MHDKSVSEVIMTTVTKIERKKKCHDPKDLIIIIKLSSHEQV